MFERNDYELNNCTFVKTVLMILVCVVHCTDFWTGEWFKVVPVYKESIGLDWFSNYIGTFHVYAFIFVSGYLFQFMKNERMGYSKYKPFILNKCKRLIVPYIFVSIVWVIPITMYFYNFTIKQVFINYILCTSPSQLWFLWVLFDIFIMIWPLTNILNNTVGLFAVCIMSFVIGNLGVYFFPNIFCIWTALLHMPIFILGMKLREKKIWAIRNIPNIIYVIIDIALFIIYMELNNLDGLFFEIITTCVRLLLNIVGSFMVFFILQRIAMVFNNYRSNKVFVFFEKRTMPIYLFHQQVIYITIVWLNGINPYIHSLINLLLAMSTSLLISSVLLVFKRTRVLLGEK